MYVGVRDIIIQHAGYSTIAEGLATLGLNAVELALGRNLSIPLPAAPLDGARCELTSVATMEAAKREYDDAGMHVCGLLVANNFNADDIDAEVQWVADALAIADCLEADAVRIDSAMTGQQQIPLAERIDIYASVVGRALQAASECTTPLAMENHGLQGIDHEWLQGVLDKTDSPRLGVTLDTANSYWAGLPLDEVYAAIEQFAPYTKHTHCKNITFEARQRNIRRPRAWDYGAHVCPLPDGDIDHFRVARILQEAGYAGGLNIEDESLGKFDEPERQRQLQRDADHLAEVAEAAAGSRLYVGA